MVWCWSIIALLSATKLNVSWGFGLPPSTKQKTFLFTGSSSGGEERTLPSRTQGAALTIEGITCSHDGGQRYELDGVSYILPKGARVGLVGRNGCGKSTLLKIIYGECSGQQPEFAYNGVVEKGKDVRVVSLVEQEPPSPSDITVMDALLGLVRVSSDPVYDIVREYRQACDSPASLTAERLASLTAAMDSYDGWRLLTQAEEIATRFRVHHLLPSPLHNLSGGERKRVALASALLSQPQVLLMDEPTNHLDLPGIHYLSDYLLNTPQGRKITLLFVTHDRAFLDQICDSMLELDQGSLYSYNLINNDDNYLSPYATYLQQKHARMELAQAAYQAQKNKYKQELDWMRRQPQARESKSKARIDAFYKLQNAMKPTLTPTDLKLTQNSDKRRIGNTILKLQNACLSFPPTDSNEENPRVILDDFSYEFKRGDRIGIVGTNGVGKSTFLKVLTGEQTIDSGSVATGETVVFGFYDQIGFTSGEEGDELTVLDFVKQKVVQNDGSSMAEAPQEAMRLLKQFQFNRDRWNQRISVLSGGEKRRLQLLSVLTKRPNFLILDEPTNDVDLDTLTTLERYLQEEFDGVLVVVSHDRYFTDKVTDHLFVFEGSGVVKDYLGSLSDYASCLILQEDMSAGGDVATTLLTDQHSVATDNNENIERKLSYKEKKEKRLQKRNSLQKMKREMNSLEKSIEKLKIQTRNFQEEIDASSEKGWSVLADLTDQMQAVQMDIDDKEMRWLELAEVVEESEVENA